MRKRQVKVVQWHPAFDAAMQIELEEEAENLTFEAEHLLSNKPLQIDLLVIKKNKKIAIRKNIGQIFREYNIIEYKSPDDNLSTDDFYKVYGYTCFYKADTLHINEHPAEELTITFACYHYPTVMLRRLKEERGILPRKVDDGIYYLEGDAIPIQLLIIPELSKKDNYWLNLLRKDLKAGSELDDFVTRYDSIKVTKLHEAVADAVVRANIDKMKEGYEMCEALRELAQEIGEEIAEKLAQEKAEKLAQEKVEKEIAKERIHIIIRTYQKGYSIEDTAEMLEISPEEVAQVYRIIQEFSPEYDVEKVYDTLCQKNL